MQLYLRWWIAHVDRSVGERIYGEGERLCYCPSGVSGAKPAHGSKEILGYVAKDFAGFTWCVSGCMNKGDKFFEEARFVMILYYYESEGITFQFLSYEIVKLIVLFEFSVYALKVVPIGLVRYC